MCLDRTSSTYIERNNYTLILPSCYSINRVIKDFKNYNILLDSRAEDMRSTSAVKRDAGHKPHPLRSEDRPDDEARMGYEIDGSMTYAYHNNIELDLCLVCQYKRRIIRFLIFGWI